MENVKFYPKIFPFSACSNRPLWPVDFFTCLFLEKNSKLFKMLEKIFDIASGNYGDEHRLFAQMIMAKGVVKVFSIFFT